MHQTVTIWHFDEVSEEWKKSFWKNASVYKAFGQASDSAGVKNNSKIKVRIFTTSDVTVSEGDYIYLGYDKSAEINKANCEKITEFSDRRIGKNPHWRIGAI